MQLKFTLFLVLDDVRRLFQTLAHQIVFSHNDTQILEHSRQFLLLLDSKWMQNEAFVGAETEEDSLNFEREKSRKSSI